jgi:hypothetical protein
MAIQSPGMYPAVRGPEGNWASAVVVSHDPTTLSFRWLHQMFCNQTDSISYLDHQLVSQTLSPKQCATACMQPITSGDVTSPTEAGADPPAKLQRLGCSARLLTVERQDRELGELEVQQAAAISQAKIRLAAMSKLIVDMDAQLRHSELQLRIQSHNFWQTTKAANDLVKRIDTGAQKLAVLG